MQSLKLISCPPDSGDVLVIGLRENGDRDPAVCELANARDVLLLLLLAME